MTTGNGPSLDPAEAVDKPCPYCRGNVPGDGCNACFDTGRDLIEVTP